MPADRSAWVAAMVGYVARRARLVLLMIIMLTAVAGWYGAERFRMNSDLGSLIEQEAGWRDDFDRFEAEFPMLIDTAMVVVWGESFHGVENTTRRIEHALRERADVFQDVYSPGNDPFFRDHVLLYLDLDRLQDTVDRLAEAQPMLTAVAEDPTLRGVLGVVGDGVVHEPVTGFDRMLDLLIESADGVLRGEGGAIAWADEFFETGDERIFRVVFAKGRATNGDLLPNATIMTELSKLLASTHLDPGVTVQVGGEIALAYEEIKAAQQGVATAGTLSFVLLAIVLFIGIRSARIIIATVTLVVVGVIWTSAWAMLSVGEFNTLSLVFLAMFFGLGVDFSIHYCLRYEEALSQGDDNVTALVRAASSVGGAIMLCSITTAIGFLGFVATDYAGLADLGIISAGGMVVAAALTFLFLPAFFVTFGAPRRLRAVDVPSVDRWVKAMVRSRSFALPVLLVLSAGAVYIDRQAYFDFSVLALRDQGSPSMQTLRLLNEEGIVTDYSLAVLGDAPAGDSSLHRVAALSVVKEVRSPEGFLPEDQDEKLTVIADISILLDSALNPVRKQERLSDDERLAVLRELVALIAANPSSDELHGPRLNRLQVSLASLTERGSAAIRSFELGVVADLETELDWLRRAVAVRAMKFEDLPDAMSSRLVSANGVYLSQVLPEQDIGRVENLKAFVEQVRAVAPDATGRPVIEWGVGQIVVASFIEALTIAVIGIAVVLVVALRSARDAMLVLTPLVLAAVFTVAVAVVLDIPFNMANILVLPLIFGLGVDNGIHVVDRYRRVRDVGHLMHSSTPRAVLLSTLTTVGAFASLMLSPHQGTASIGALLTIAVMFLLVFTVFVLPMLLSTMAGSAQDEVPRESRE